MIRSKAGRFNVIVKRCKIWIYYEKIMDWRYLRAGTNPVQNIQSAATVIRIGDSQLSHLWNSRLRKLYSFLILTFNGFHRLNHKSQKHISKWNQQILRYNSINYSVTCLSNSKLPLLFLNKICYDFVNCIFPIARR